MEQLLLVTSCDSPAGIGASLRTDGRTDGRTDERMHTGWTDRRDVGNSILHMIPMLWILLRNSIFLVEIEFEKYLLGNINKFGI